MKSAGNLTQIGPNAWLDMSKVVGIQRYDYQATNDRLTIYYPKLQTFSFNVTELFPEFLAQFGFE